MKTWEVCKPLDMDLELYNRSVVWQMPRQQYSAAELFNDLTPNVTTMFRHIMIMLPSLKQ